MRYARASCRAMEPPVSRHRNLHKVMNIVQSASGLLQIIISPALAHKDLAIFHISRVYSPQSSRDALSLSL